MFAEYGDIMTIDDLAEALMIGRNRCYKLLKSEEIKGFRVGAVWKIPKESLIQYVRNSCMGSPS